MSTQIPAEENSNKAKRRWFWWHKWSSLICTLFLLQLCITGLPLIFHHEIEEWTEAEHKLPPSDLVANLDDMLNSAKVQVPGKQVVFIGTDDESAISVLLADSVNGRGGDDYSLLHYSKSTGKMVAEPEKPGGFMYVMYRLHVDMYAGIAGKMFMALMGLLFLIAIVSGVVLYAPIMKKYAFGMVRKDKSLRLKWLDTHNMVGIIVLVWMFVVGFTGVINDFADVVLFAWQKGQLAEMTESYKGVPKFSRDEKLYSVDKIYKEVLKKYPDDKLFFIAFPGSVYTSDYHYAYVLKGTTAMTSHMYRPVLVDAKTGQISEARRLPWYVDAVFLSQPLHFGDYAGLPLKIIWALLDIAAIIVLITGLVLWLKRRKAEKLHSLKNAQINQYEFKD